MRNSFSAEALVSLCVIARDEAQNLPRLLASAAPWVGEIVVVDTGSVDDTAVIAATHGARVVHCAWQNSFAVARNQSLDAATLPWALVLDADEELVVTDGAAFAAGVNGGQTAFAVDCHDLRDDGTHAIAPLLRLFRREPPTMRYEGAVHEQLIAVARGEVGVAHAAFMHFRHDGHTTHALSLRKKDERNLSLARAQVSAANHDPFAWFCMGQALLTQPTTQRQEQAVVAFAQALANLTAVHEGEAFVVSLFASYAATCKTLARNDQALQLLNTALQGFPDSPDLRLARGGLLMTVADLAAAEQDFRACLTQEAHDFFVRLNPHTTGSEAHLALGLCLVKQGRIPEGAEQLRKAAAAAPAHDSRAAALLAALGERR